jgi:CBS domain containing-hemolysin-like protein
VSEVDSAAAWLLRRLPVANCQTISRTYLSDGGEVMEYLTSLTMAMGLDAVDWELTLRIVIQILLLISSAVFSGSETALFSLSRIDLQKLRQSRDRHSESIHAMLDEPRRLIISILCGNELVNIASAVNMTGILLLLFGDADITWINIMIMVPLLLLIGEVTPKTIAVSFPVKFSTGLSARILPRWIVLITPLREAVRAVADRITTLIVGDDVNRENILQPDELKTLLEESEESGVIDATERVLIDNVLEASETDISRIMTPSPLIMFLDASLPVPELVTKFREYQHPRVPVFKEHWDNVIGFLHSEDMLKLTRGGGDLESASLDALLKPAHFVPPTKKVDEMFDYFQEHKTRVAIILGEYGEVLGIVTMKDVVKFIFGEISGRMEGQEFYQERDENSYIVPGEMRLTDFYNLTNFDIEDPVMTTIGGVAFRLFDRLPKVGECVNSEGYEFVAQEVTGLRISKIKVSKIAAGESKSEESPAVEEESLGEGDEGNKGGEGQPVAADAQGRESGESGASAPDEASADAVSAKPAENRQEDK